MAFFSAALLFMLAAAATAVADRFSDAWWLHWSALHLVFLGGVSQLVLGAAQFFVCAFLATDPPPRRMIAAQLVAWNTGTVLVAVGVPSATPRLVEAGGALILTGLVLFAVALAGMERRSLQQARWALRWYELSAACLGVGAVLGVLMARGTTWPHGSLLGAHLALNLGGWMGAAIVGTLHTFFPSLTQTRLRHPRLQGPTFWLWLLGIAGLAAGAAYASRWLLAVAWLDLLVAAALLAANLLGSLRASAMTLALPARLLAVAQLFLPAGLVLALVATVRDGVYGPFTGDARPTLAALLLAGWIGMTVTGSLLHLLAVLARVRNFARPMPVPRPARDRAVALAAGIAVAGLACSQVAALGGLAGPASALLVGVAVVLGVRVLALAARGLHPR